MNIFLVTVIVTHIGPPFPMWYYLASIFHDHLDWVTLCKCFIRKLDLKVNLIENIFYKFSIIKKILCESVVRPLYLKILYPGIHSISESYLRGGKCICTVCVQTVFFLLLLIEYCNHLLSIYILFDTISNPKIIYNTWDVIDRLYANITPFPIRGFNIWGRRMGTLVRVLHR